ncbi:MAG: hypothetical protein NTV86_03685 [Planctomycetota bacterium]|nr:hypothetical protein [Planctomycetota bacterium]
MITEDEMEPVFGDFAPTGRALSRVSVPGGWIYVYEAALGSDDGSCAIGVTTVFVPDPPKAVKIPKSHQA